MAATLSMPSTLDRVRIVERSSPRAIASTIALPGARRAVSGRIPANSADRARRAPSLRTSETTSDGSFASTARVGFTLSRYMEALITPS
jgi:hypothetical protein